MRLALPAASNICSTSSGPAFGGCLCNLVERLLCFALATISVCRRPAKISRECSFFKEAMGKNQISLNLVTRTEHRSIASMVVCAIVPRDRAKAYMKLYFGKGPGRRPPWESFPNYLYVT